MTPEEYLTKARRALASAKLLLDDGDVSGACNRAYYAMYEAAHAAIFVCAEGVNPAEIKTHNGLISAFGRYLVKTQRLPAALGKSLNQVERIRLLADYTGEEMPVDKVTWTVDEASAFIEAVEQEVTSGSR